MGRDRCASVRRGWPVGRVLYTTRHEYVLESVGAAVRRVDVLDAVAARELLARLTGRAADALPVEAEPVLAATGRVALAVALVGAAIGNGGRDWGAVATDLSAASGTFRQHPYADVFKAMQIGVAGLDAHLASAYRTLAVFPRDQRVPVTAIERLWAHIAAAATPQATLALLEQLAARQLLCSTRAIHFHDLQHEFLLLQEGDMALKHADLLDAYQSLLGDRSSHWRHLPHDGPYIWDHLLYHLRGSGDGAAVYAPMTDLAYVAVRSARNGPYAVETDLRLAARLYPRDGAIQWLLDLYAHWGYLFAGLDTPASVSMALAMRTQPARTTERRRAPHRQPRTSADSALGLAESPDGLVRSIGGHHRNLGVRAVAFSPNGALLATADHISVRLWDTATGELAQVMNRRGSESVTFSSDGSRLATGGGAWRVRLWDIAPGHIRPSAARSRKLAGAFALSPDGSILSVHDIHGTTRLCDLATGRTRTFKDRGYHHHSGDYRGAVAFSPDGRWFATSGYGRIQLLLTATGEIIHTLDKGGGPLAFSPTGTRWATGTMTASSAYGTAPPAKGRATRSARTLA